MKKSHIIAAVVLSSLFLLTRFFNLAKSPVWEDNFSWLYRLNYYPWLIETNFKGHPEPGRDLAYTGKISYHPGVTVMTLSGLSTRIGKKILTSAIPSYKSCLYNDTLCPYLQQELFIAKLPLIILYAILFYWCLMLVNKHFGLTTQIIFGVFILAEPIFYQTSRDLHLDFLQAILITTSFLLILNKNRVLGGILLGLTVLTRFSSIFFLPGLLIILVIQDKKFYFAWLKTLLAAVLTFVLCYPPMLVAPISTLKYIVEGSGTSSGITTYPAGFLASYVNGFSVYLSQAFNSVNGVSYIWVASFLLSVTYLCIKIRFVPEKHRLYYLILFFGGYLLFLNISDKRFFRYLCPILMAASILIGYVSSVVSQQIIKLFILNSFLRNILSKYSR